MKIGGGNIKKRLYGGVYRLGNRLVRARFFRGHGVHSPFVYGIVRQVFMRRELFPGDHALYHALVGAGVTVRRAVQLQNLCIHCNYATFGLNRADADLCVVLPGLSLDETLGIVRRAAARGGTVVVLSPYEGRERQALCRLIVRTHASTSVDNRGYLLIFNNGLPKQHFRI